MAKWNINKRFVAILLTMVMLVNGFQIVGSAAGSGEFSLVQNFEDTYYKQDGSVGSAEDWEIHLSKIATPTDQDNVYDITVKVETKDTSIQTAGSTNGAAVLVLDVSNSMDQREDNCAQCGKHAWNAEHCTNYDAQRPWLDICSKCGQREAQHSQHHRFEARTQLDSLKEAVAGFLNTFAEGAGAGEQRLIAVVAFGTNAKTIQSWVDISDAAARQALIAKINTLSTGDGAYLGNQYLFRGGTNMEGGLVLGRNLLKQNAVAQIPTENQSMILFSDGAPTARADNPNSTSVDEVKYGGSDTGSKTDPGDYDDVGRILADISAAKIAVAYNYDDELGILKAPPFTRVLNSGADSLTVDLQGEAGKVITSKTNASTVTDPMGSGVSMLTVTSSYNSITQNWDLSQITPVIANGITTYTITYQVQIDPTAVELDPAFPGYTLLTPANGQTTLNYTYGANDEVIRADFNEPSIRGIRTFTVSYDYVGEVPEGAPMVPAEKTYKAGEAVQIADIPTLENYTFSGWSKTNFEMPAEDVLIVGSWEENAKYDYTLIYNANFGANETKADAQNITDTYAVTYNITVDANTFLRPNYTFVGWNTEADGSGKTYAADNTVELTAANNTEVLYAQWIENTKYAYTVIYDANFGANETKADAENVSGVYDTQYTIGVDANPFVRENYTFIGWATTPEGEVVYNAGDSILFTEGGEQILYAQWIEDPKYSYSVIYNGNGGNLENGELSYGDSQNVQETYATRYNVDVDGNTFLRANYTFLGWNTEADGSGKAYAAGEVIALTAEDNTETLYAQWQEHPKYDYSVIYNANFGDNATKADAENISATYSVKHNVNVDANSFYRANYTFLGWNTEADGSGKAYAAGEVIALTAEDNTEVLYAQWQEHPKYDYSVIYNANFGENETKADAQNVSATYATAHNVDVDANTFQRANYTFVGWNTEADGSGKTYAAGEVVALTAEDNTETLYAQWEENPKYDYSVIYNANFGDNETKADAQNVSGVYDTRYTIGVDANPFVRENFTFIGWATAPDGEVIYNVDDSILFTEGGEQILYAQWIEHNKYNYNVIYNGNGGILENGELSYGDSQNIQQTYATTHNVDVDGNTFYRENYTFLGWNTEADGSGIAYTAEDVIALTAEINTETLYAQWEENPKYDYSVIYNANFGDNETKADEQNVVGIYETAYGITVNENSFLRANYAFLGWNTEADGSGKAYAAGEVIDLTAEENTEVLYAQWQINSYRYTVNYWVRVNEEAYIIFAGELEGAPMGEEAPFGTVIDQAYLTEKGLPATLTEGENVYNFTAFEGVTVADAQNVVNVYYTCVVEETIEIPEDDVPLGDDPLPKTGDPIFVYLGSAAASAAGLLGLFLTRSKKEEEEA